MKLLYILRYGFAAKSALLLLVDYSLRLKEISAPVFFLIDDKNLVHRRDKPRTMVDPTPLHHGYFREMGFLYQFWKRLHVDSPLQM